jgi:hypothetical protein
MESLPDFVLWTLQLEWTGLKIQCAQPTLTGDQAVEAHPARVGRVPPLSTRLEMGAPGFETGWC